MAVKVKTYLLPPTPRIPNSPYPLLHYPGLLKDTVSAPDFSATQILDLFASNGWQTQWIARYGPDIQSHYHSTTHECMAVIAGTGATIRFGVADSPGWNPETFGVGERADGEPGGLDIDVGLGDVFVIPAGVSHKTFAPRPACHDLAFHQPEDMARVHLANNTTLHSPPNHHTEQDHRKFFANVPLDQHFTQLGAYPYGGVWDFAVGGEHEGKEDTVWNIPPPERDPVLGESEEGLRGLWADV